MQTTSMQILKNNNQNENLEGGFNVFKTMNKRIKNEKGLTLIELLAVIVILAIVAAIAVPAIGNIIDNSRYNAVKSDAINVINAAQLYYTDNPNGEDNTGSAGEDTTTAVSVKGLKTAGYLDSVGEFPEDTSVKVTKAKPHAISGASSTNVNGHTVTFSSATIDIINDDSTKGSEINADITVPETVVND